MSLLSVTGVLLTLFFILLAQYDPPLLHKLHLQSFDFFLRHSLAPVSDNPRIIIIDVDSESLKKLGQWPWARNRIAELLTKTTK
ncbi:MAG: CHASE2 domain-containing protein, partial [Candidatus Electrothrix sp. ATG2]|nr:CHASE2 domain-containing protein [Candidatus Electrothrix sp. ATG2]